MEVSTFPAEELLTEAGGSLAPAVFEHFMYGLALADPDGRLYYLNRLARQMLTSEKLSADSPLTCCGAICGQLGEMLGTGCVTREALERGAQTPEVRVDIAHGARHESAAWVTASPLKGEKAGVLFHLRPGTTFDRRRRAEVDWIGAGEPTELQISSLGPLRVEVAGVPVASEWLARRPGQLLKLLIAERRRVITADRISESLWPEAGADQASGRLRLHVHALREKLEPRRAHREPARFVLARGGGYVLETRGARVDADEFEREALAGLSALTRGEGRSADGHLRAAAAIYRGDFLAEDPYAHWAYEERERLRELAGRTLRGLIGIELARDDMHSAATHGRRLAEMEPYDVDIHTQLVAICLRRGRHSEALRRHDLFRKRMRETFGSSPEIDWTDLERVARSPERLIGLGT